MEKLESTFLLSPDNCGTGTNYICESTKIVLSCFPYTPGRLLGHVLCRTSVSNRAGTLPVALGQCVNMKGGVLIYHWPDRRLGFKSNDLHHYH